MVGCRVELPVCLGFVAHTSNKIADGNTRIGNCIRCRVLHDAHERNKTAMAPTHHSGSLRIEKAVAVEHPLRAVVDIVDLASAVIDVLVERSAIPGAAAIVTSNDRITL